MDRYSCPYIIPNNSPHNPFPHSLLRTRQPLSPVDLAREVALPYDIDGQSSRLGRL